MDFLNKFKTALEKNGELYFKVKVIPGAPETGVKNVMDDGVVKIAVAAPPEKGRANKTLVDFLAQEFGVPDESVKIISGVSARVKLVKIYNAGSK
jgi:hypothetical protein